MSTVPLASVLMEGTFSGRPAAGSAGRLYFAADVAKIYYDNGAGWDDVSPATTALQFLIGNGNAGTNIAPLTAPAPRSGIVSSCVIRIVQSDPTTGLTFRIKQNGTDIFTVDPGFAAGVSPGTTGAGGLSSVPLPIAKGDIFTVDILVGTPNWQFTATLE